jgi:nitrile hydratase
MNGIHDMGGMDGFGTVVAEPNEPVFHEDWEKRVFALVNGVLGLIGRNVDEFRHAIERIPPDRYLRSSYYERWLQAAETLLMEHGLVSAQELDTLPAPEQGASAAPAAAVSSMSRAPRVRAKFKAGDRVRVRNINPPGHTRCPRYARGKLGIIRRDNGVYVFPDTNAHRAGENRQHVYSVEFTARELWGKRAAETVRLDLWEDHLEPSPRPARAAKRTAAAGRKRKRR